MQQLAAVGPVAARVVVARFQDSKIPRFQDFKISRFQESWNLEILKSWEFAALVVVSSVAAEVAVQDHH